MKSELKVIRTGRFSQALVRKYYLFGFNVWTTILDTEEITMFVVISCACFGDCGGWKSKFHDVCVF